MRSASSPPVRKPTKTGSTSSDSVYPEATRRGPRERLVQAAIELWARSGSQSTTIAEICAHAGVSTATFYEHFAGKEECMVTAHRVACESVLSEVLPTDEALRPDEAGWREAALATLERTFAALQRDRDGAQVLLVGALAGGTLLRSEGAQACRQFERRAEQLLQSAPAAQMRVEVPAVAVVAALRSICARRLHGGHEDALAALAPELLVWLCSYSVAANTPPVASRLDALVPTTVVAKPSKRASPRRLPRGRHGLPASVVAHSRRTRIIQATAEVTMAKGYNETTVKDIVAAAGISREAFYEHFADKQAAFLEAQAYPTQYIVERCAAAYFAAEGWPTRVWMALSALVKLVAVNPAVAHLRLVECYAAGPAAIRGAEEITRSFAIFLEEGYSYREESRALPRLCSEAIAGAIFEVMRRSVVRGEGATLQHQLPLLTYLAIAPFTGAEEAARLVAQMGSQRLMAAGR